MSIKRKYPSGESREAAAWPFHLRYNRQQNNRSTLTKNNKPCKSKIYRVCCFCRDEKIRTSDLLTHAGDRYNLHRLYSFVISPKGSRLLFQKTDQYLPLLYAPKTGRYRQNKPQSYHLKILKHHLIQWYL